MKTAVGRFLKAGVIVFLSMLIIPACNLSSPTAADETGALSISVSLANAKITGVDITESNFSFIISGTGPSGNTFSVTTERGVLSANIEDLAIGAWTISAEALYYDGVNDVSFGDGSASITIDRNSTSTCAISITPFSGTGTLQITVNWDNSMVTTPALNGTLSRAGYKSIVVTFTMSAGQATATLSLDSGIYNLAVVLTDVDAYEFGGFADKVRITNALTTTAQYTIVGNAGTGEAPTAPANLATTDVQSSSVSLVWDASTDNVGVTGYRVYRDGVEIGVSAGNSYTDSTVLAASTYVYSVAAYDAAGNISELSNTLSVTTPGAPTVSQIIADHTVVDLYSRIPAEYITAVKKMLVDIPGESHSLGYRIGMDLLELQNSTFASQTFSDAIPAATESYLRLGKHGTVGESDFYTNSTAISTIKSLITTQETNGNPIHVLGFGWCWDMTWLSYTNSNGTNGRDPVYDVHWYGASVGGPEGNYIWGLDASDQTITGNSVCMDTYLNAVEAYIKHCTDNAYSCKVIFTTGPVDDNNGNEIGFQREIKHDYIRNYVAKDSSRILFDYADILCYNNSGVVAEYTWNDSVSGTARVHKGIHSDNMKDYDDSWNIIAFTEDGDHIGEVGTLRLAKAMWWMLARIAGWDGN